MFSVREKPWHGLGKIVMEAPTSKDALRLAGLDWNVVQEPIYTEFNEVVEGYKANVRKPLNTGTVGCNKSDLHQFYIK